MELITEFPLLGEKTVLSKSTRLIRGREYPQTSMWEVELVTCNLSFVRLALRIWLLMDVAPLPGFIRGGGLQSVGTARGALAIL